MKNSIDLSIIIINYNTLDLTTQCIKSIIKETSSINFEIIVIDNASSEKNIESLKEIDSSVKLIKNTQNLGFGIANNIGMEAARGEYVLLLNSDTIIIDKGINKCLAYIQNHSEIGVLTCRQVNENFVPFIPRSFYFKNNSVSQLFFKNPILEIIKNKLDKKAKANLTENSYVKSLSGAFMLFNKTVFEKTKGFDPDFFIYYEETEWCMRINKQFKQFYLNDVSFIHLHGKSSPRAIMQKQMLLSQGLFWYKSGYLKFILFLITTYFIHIPSWLILTIFSLKKSSRIHFLKYVRIYFKLLQYYILAITNSKKSFGSRNEFLKLKELH
jgi:GT2 family glycosyltransferase